ncbi:hypothetical protein U27_06674 [Candidatus Vecturithrix granuli]|uniref:Uncharacterized protein n=1 Tax=Vecturithrix granuli TaxID=1499967 RepID=A0A081C534_VECG1|nr:hypothetical protein U27_06674 [Candidatus Vecturithrix granuli]
MTPCFIMAHHSKKSKKKPAGTPQPQRYTQSEMIARYFLAAAGLVVLIVVILGILGYFKVI